MRVAQIVKQQGLFDPTYVYGTGNQPVYTLMFEVDNAGKPLSMKLSNGATQFQNLQNLLSAVVNAADITQDATHRFVTDTQISSWTGKADTSALTAGLATKQATLVSGANIRTINGQSLLGNTDLVITAGSSAWSAITGKPTTLAGYGITDAEPSITAGTTDQYLRGDKTLASALFFPKPEVFSGGGPSTSIQRHEEE